MAEGMMRLSDLCDLIAEQVDPRDCGRAVYVGLEHVAPGRFTRVGHGSAADVQSAKYAFRPGDILYGKLRPYLDKAVLAEDEGVCTTELLVLRPKKKVDPRFVVSALHAPAFVEYAIFGTTGVQHPRTSWSHIGNFELPAFDADEQSKIADLLWQVHNAIVANDVAHTATMDLKRAAMGTLFTRGLRGEAQKETEIGPVPESWDPAAVGCFAAVKGGKRMPKGVSLTKENTGKPYIRVTDFQDHGVAVDQVLFVPRGYEGLINRYIISCKDVYVSIAGTIGLVGQVPKCLEGANLTENAAKICITNSHVAARFAMYALASDACQLQIAQATGKNAQPKLALVRIEQVKIPLPQTLEEQHEIVAILDTIDRKINLQCKKRAVLEELFRALLHKLMTGEIRVGDLDLSSLPRMPDLVVEATR